MTELFDFFSQSQNWLYAFFITFSLCIWLISALGLIGGGQDSSVEMETDTDLDLEVEADLETEFSWGDALTHIAAFLGIGKVPFSIVLTVLMFGQGVLGMSANYFLNKFLGIESSWLSHSLVFLGSFTGAFFATALITKVLSPIFKDYGKVSTPQDMVGQTAILTSSRVSTQFGQATIKLTNGDHIEIAVRAHDDQNQIRYGETLLIIDYLPEKNIYLIEKLN